MELVRWSPRLSVGVTEFDNQHENMIEMINTLHAAMKTGKGASITGDIIDGLIAYTGSHFAAEELLMLQHSFQDLKNTRPNMPHWSSRCCRCSRDTRKVKRFPRP